MGKDLKANIDNFLNAWERFSLKGVRIWKVPVLCKTDRGIIIVGEFHIDKDDDYIDVPTKEEMMKTVELQINKLPFLYYGTRKELNKQKIKPITI